jgi:hypothetical protein
MRQLSPSHYAELAPLAAPVAASACGATPASKPAAVAHLSGPRTTGPQTPGAPHLSHPLDAQLAAEVPALRQPATHHPGLHRFFQGATWLSAGILLLLTAGLTALKVTEPAGMFPDAVDRRHRRPCRRRNQRAHTVVPAGTATAWAEASFRAA